MPLKCSPFTGVWQEPDMSQCYNTEGITQQLKNISNEDIDKENVEEVSTKLSDISKKSVYFKVEDIDLAVDIHEKMLPLISNVSANITLHNILLSINDMINTPEEILVEAEKSKRTGSRMLDILEAIPEEIPLEGQPLTIAYSNIGVGITKVEEKSFNGLFYGVLYGNKETKVKTMIYNSSYAETPQEETKDMDFISLPRSLMKHLQDEGLSTMSRISFVFMRDDKIQRNATNLRCVYWDEILGNWSGEGCKRSHNISGEKVFCSCNHLTSFAIIMDVYQTGNGPNDEILSILSNVGCGISLVCLILTIIIHVCSKNLRKLMTSKILVYLCISLAVSNLIFLVGMQEYATTKPAACKAVAALIHYFLMTSLMWMTVEVLQVCLAVDVISQTVQRSFMIRSSILAWGLPMIIVTVTLAINYTNNYIRIEQTCWLSAVPFYTALVAPMGIILIFNIFIFSIDVWYLMTLETNKPFKLETKRTRILGIVGVFVLFSAAWILAFFSFGETDEVFTLLFAIFNILQGMFVFFYYCIYMKNTRDVIFSCVHKRKEANTRGNVTYNNSSTNRERREVELAETGPYLNI
ncbi:adhesion G-protein coupled receptor G6-like isoform X2 [Octopus sinensis]|uniref:Adhesion G-protein coupled receptor G6-like isoform X2 n=1 Tax=Octopus sinensis TaxID=2607531 RepID=A0A7E6FQ71_9MOLL|nr:adhesion G-protein coupled receptor G6-like isoform X2 [Octopus sinensis]